MVFEKFYTSEFLKNKKYFIFIIALAYSVFGIAGSVLLFRTFTPSTTSLALISLILLVVLKDVLRSSDVSTNTNKNTIITIFQEYKNYILLFGYIFAGVMLCFGLFSIILPVESTSQMFESQYSLLGSSHADQIFSYDVFHVILINNLIVMLVCIITSFLFGIQTIYLFIVIWNASVVGVIFGVTAKETALLSGLSPFVIFLLIIVASLPHIIFEISSFLVAGVTGQHFSNFLFFGRNKRKNYFTVIKLSIYSIAVSIILLVLGALLESSFAPALLKWLF